MCQQRWGRGTFSSGTVVSAACTNVTIVRMVFVICSFAVTDIERIDTSGAVDASGYTGVACRTSASTSQIIDGDFRDDWHGGEVS